MQDRVSLVVDYTMQRPMEVGSLVVVSEQAAEDGDEEESRMHRYAVFQREGIKVLLCLTVV